MEWGEPKNFIWLWILPLAGGLFYLAFFRKRTQLARFGEAELVKRLLSSFSSAQRLFKQILILIAVFFIILALCQPHFRTREITVERKGVDVILAVDVSRSMLAKDIAPNRLEKAKLELSTLIDRLKQDRIGVVAFAGEAFIQCPLTLDKSAVKLFLSTLSPDIIPLPGTSIGSAIRVATDAFSEKEKEFKAVVLLTDGEDHQSNPLSAAIRSRQSGVKIFTIGIGTSEGSILPDADEMGSFKKDRQGRAVLSKLDETLLRNIAEETGGIYHRSSRGEIEVDRIINEINKMTQKGLKHDKIIEYEESYQTFLALAFIFLMIEMFLSERRRGV